MRNTAETHLKHKVVKSSQMTSQRKWRFQAIANLGSTDATNVWSWTKVSSHAQGCSVTNIPNHSARNTTRRRNQLSLRTVPHGSMGATIAESWTKVSWLVPKSYAESNKSQCAWSISHLLIVQAGTMDATLAVLKMVRFLLALKWRV